MPEVGSPPRSSFRGARQREPGIHLSARLAARWISGLTLRVPRNDEGETYVSTSPVVEPLADESLCPCGSARYDSELISIRRDDVRLNSLASLPSVAR